MIASPLCSFTDTVLVPFKSALNAAFTQGTLGYEGSLIWREES